MVRSLSPDGGRFVEDVRENVDRIEDCERFKFVETDTGKDQGLNVREKCKVRQTWHAIYRITDM